MKIDFNKTEFTQDEVIYIVKNKLQFKLNIGDKLKLNNEYCNTFEVIGKDHDSSINTIDIMPIANVIRLKFNTSNNNDYSKSEVRRFINGKYIESFDKNIQDLFKVMSVKVNIHNNNGSTTITLKDKAKILSAVEMNYSSFHSNMHGGYTGNTNDKEGEPYLDTFHTTKYNSRSEDRVRDNSKYITSTRDSKGYHWLRSRVTGSNTDVWVVDRYGDGSNHYMAIDDMGVLPVMRL